SIADDLRMGMPVRSEMHPSVSLLVTDICKYTELCETTIPVQVENVGDTYLLVSGLQELPHHLCEVCRLALELLE
ncbi:hypothetical protein TELCIR_24387, partial [Teladorsagia circumcincta]